ncbi:MAG: hypothetical protein K6F72_08515 [Bacteroidales bacterium]|nr:hypothetical protein [Bacteroidales bacterium]
MKKIGKWQVEGWEKGGMGLEEGRGMVRMGLVEGREVVRMGLVEGRGRAGVDKKIKKMYCIYKKKCIFVH